MSFFSKNRIKLFLVLLFVLVSIFGNINNVFAQETITTANIDTKNVELMNKEAERSSLTIEIIDFYKECKWYHLAVNGECSANYISKKIGEKENTIKTLNTEINNLQTAIDLYKATSKETTQKEQIPPEKAPTETTDNKDTTAPSKPGSAKGEGSVDPIDSTSGVGVGERTTPFIDPIEVCQSGYFFDISFSPACFRYVLAIILETVVSIVGYFTTNIASGFFTMVVEMSVNNIASFGQLVAVTKTWMILRDLVNMFALLIMMYIAIGTILDVLGGSWKKMIGNMIIAIILINFSMAITGVIIDTSNVFAVYFYDKAKGGPNGNISNIIIDRLSLTRQIKEGFAAAEKTSTIDQARVPSFGSIIVNNIMTLIVMLVLFFVLMVASVLFIVRIVSLVFALIFSPLPWLGMMMPKYGEKISGDYWNSLFNQAFFAPVFMLCLYISMRLIACIDGLQTITEKNMVQMPILGGTLNSIFFNVLILSFLIGTITAAKKMGAAGASGAEKFGKWATGAAIARVGAAAGIGRGTILSGARGLSKGSEGQEGGRVMGTLKNIGDEWTKTVGKPVAEKVSTKAGMTFESIKGAVGTPQAALSTGAGLFKSATGFDILPGVGESREAEKAEKEYKAKQEAAKNKARIEEISKMEKISEEKYKNLSEEDKVKYNSEQRKIEKEVQDILENFRGDKILELGIKNLKANNGRIAQWMNESQLKAVENHADTKPEELNLIKNAIFDNTANFRGRKAVESDIVEQRWKTAGFDKATTIKEMSSKNIAGLSEEILKDNESIKAFHKDDIKEIRKTRGNVLADEIEKKRENLKNMEEESEEELKQQQEDTEIKQINDEIQNLKQQYAEKSGLLKEQEPILAKIKELENRLSS